MTKGYRFGRSTKKKQAREAIFHAGKYSFAHRKDKKNDFRRLWTVRINAGLDVAGTIVEATGKALSYSRLIEAMTKGSITINRKMLALIAERRPETFTRIISAATTSTKSIAAGAKAKKVS